MGYAFVTSSCGCCGKLMSYNPVKVPSFRFDGVTKEPICEICIKIVNAKRKEKGLDLWPIAYDAYACCREEELG